MSQFKNLKNVKDFGYRKLAILGIAGAIILAIYSVLASILNYVFDWSIIEIAFQYIGLGLGLIYASLGVIGIIKLRKKQEGKYWIIFLISSILAIFAPLTYFIEVGVGVSLLAGLGFFIYIFLDTRK